MISDFSLAGMMQNDIPNSYTSKNVVKPLWKGPNILKSENQFSEQQICQRAIYYALQ